MTSNPINKVYSKPVLTNISAAQTEASKTQQGMEGTFTMMNDSVNGSPKGSQS